MCIQAIKSVGVKEYASELWTSIKEIDCGKILSSASALLEVNTKAIKKKLDYSYRVETVPGEYEKWCKRNRHKWQKRKAGRF